MRKKRRIRQKAAWVVTGMVLAGAISGDTVSWLKAETRETEESLTGHETPEQQEPREERIAEANDIPEPGSTPVFQSSSEGESLESERQEEEITGDILAPENGEEPESDLGEESETDSGSEDGAESKPEEESEKILECNLESESELESESGLEIESETNQESESEVESKEESEDELEMESEMNLESESEAESKEESEDELETESETDLESESEAESEEESEGELETESETDLESESEAESEEESEGELETERETNLESELEAESEEESEREQESESEAETGDIWDAESGEESGSDREQESEMESESDSKLGSEAESEAVLEPESEEESGSDSVLESEMETEIVLEPEDETEGDPELEIVIEPENLPEETEPETETVQEMETESAFESSGDTGEPMQGTTDNPPAVPETDHSEEKEEEKPEEDTPMLEVSLRQQKECGDEGLTLQINSISGKCRAETIQAELIRTRPDGREENLRYIGILQEAESGKGIIFPGFDFEHSEDGIYRLRLTAQDQEGKAYEKNIHFKVNRQGSLYELSEETQNCLSDYYRQEAFTVVLTEKNPDRLTEQKILCCQNGKWTELKRGTEYQVNLSKSGDGWNQYTYEISPEAFREEGAYEVIFVSLDANGNCTDSQLKQQKLRFSIDRTAPECVITGIEDNSRITAEKAVVSLEPKDNGEIHLVEVELNGESVLSCSGEELAEQDGRIKLTIPESENQQTLSVRIEDAAGNSCESGPFRFWVNQEAKADEAADPVTIAGQSRGEVLAEGTGEIREGTLQKKPVGQNGLPQGLLAAAASFILGIPFWRKLFFH